MGELFEKVTSPLILAEGFDRVEENHGSPGTDGQTIEVFAANLDLNLSLLQSELRSEQYRPRPLLRVGIPKETGGTRYLSIPTVRDRVAQSAVYLVLAPLLEPEFEDASFAYRPGRSVDQAIQRVLSLRNAGFTWLLDADIFHFFDEIPHDRLFALLERFVPDEKITDLLKQWTACEIWFEGKTYRMVKGIPQGSPLSPVMANLYLDRLDEAFLETQHRIVRFADDFIVLCRNRSDAEGAQALSTRILSELGLQLHPEKTRVTSFEQGFRYLGVQFLRSFAFRPIEAPEPSEGSTAAAIRSTEPLVPALPPPKSKTTVGGAFRAALEGLPPGEAAHRWSDLHVSTGSAPSDESAVSPDLPTPTAGHDPTLRTLYLMEQGAELGKEDERFVVRKEGRILAKVPALKVNQILVFGNIRLSTPSVQFCLVRDIPIYLLSSRGRYYGVIESTQGNRVMLHGAQFNRAGDDGFRLTVSRGFVKGKIANCRTVLQRHARSRSETGLQESLGRMKEMLDGLDRAETLDQLRGMEGAAAASYFSALSGLLGPEWGFSRRERQPPTDPVNSMLSFGYTLLFYNVYSLLRAAGLHPYVGIYHSLRDNHPALVSDLMEEFRAPLVDRTVLSLIDRKQVKPGDFTIGTEKEPGCFLSEDARRIVGAAFEEAFNRLVTHPDAGEKCDYRRVIFLQALRVQGAIEAREPAYEPFILK